ncbi:hypothetical protein CI109_100462 [Kwoniella shandongensis]|uniref:Uncharacterized protein n=1 Tax=Kwoniella shandongensis TaxID=1734106 RepID=A0A5M6C3P1_9TREE|nr:uncharacterized protein CI109_001695 [Kwoniella shandongensis]KAA5529756.1 hypothetical protein CI109_001695 [Kwoniella shandongensis]
MSPSATPTISASASTLFEVPTSNERTHLLKSSDDEGIQPAQRGKVIPADADVEEDETEGEEVDIYVPGKASFSQTLLNTLGDLIGTGLLACPIAIAHAGWVLGPLFLCIICAVTLYTLKILIRIIEKDRRMRNFADVARFGLGARAEKWITILFVGDCCIWLIALVVLFSDTVEAVWPIFTSNQWKVVGLAVIIPLNFVPLRFLSYTSAIGVISTWTLVAILIFTGIATPSYPGSIRDPAPTDLWPVHGPVKLGISFGLLISGFGGHFLVPNLIRDMKHPEQADRVCEVAYGICMVVYAVVSVFGYVMFGRDVSDEISRDLAKTSAFSPTLAHIAVWMVALNPLTKLPLGLRPLSDVFYTWFGLQPTVFVPTKHYQPVRSYTESLASTPRLSASSSSSSLATLEATHDDHHHLSIAEKKHDRRERIKSILRPVVSLVLVSFFVLGALSFPSFETIMGVMGGGLALISCVLIPIAAGAGIWGWRWYDIVIFALSSVAAVVGILCAVLNDRGITGL